MNRFDLPVPEPAELADRLAAIVASSDDAIISKSLEGVILSWNEGASRIFGYTPEEMIGEKLAVLVPPNRRDEIIAIIARIRRGERVDHFETVRRRKDGRDILISVSISPIRNARGEIIAASKVARDITEQRSAAAERDRFFQLSIDMLCVGAANGELRRLNPAFYETLGYTPDALLGKNLLSYVHPEDAPNTENELRRLQMGATATQFENRVRCADGTFKWLSWRSAPDTLGSFFAVARDVTAERSSREALRCSVKEKDVLLQEIHHRVKNNLQVISSLINMQVRTLGATPARHALEECQMRVQAIALIHEKLYQSKDYAKVPFSDFLKGLAANVFQLSAGDVQVSLELAIEDTTLAVDCAIPCGLIVNELITNALKHAFKGRARGQVRIELSRNGDRVRVGVIDDGVGFPEGFDIQTSPTLGLQLVTTLAQQLEAELHLARTPGTRFELEFSAPAGELA